MYIIQEKNTKGYLVYAMENKLHDGREYDGWFYTDKRTFEKLFKRNLREFDMFGRDLGFVFDEFWNAEEFLDDFVKKTPGAKRENFEIVLLSRFTCKLENPDRKKIANIVREWKKEADVRSKVFISYTHGNHFGYYKVIIGTNRPGSMCGAFGALVDKYKDLICIENKVYDVAIIETETLV